VRRRAVRRNPVRQRRLWRKVAALAAGGVLVATQLTACASLAQSGAYTAFNPAAAFPVWYIVGSLFGTGPCGDPNIVGDEVFAGCPEVRGT
jgi:hypothetical protein